LNSSVNIIAVILFVLGKVGTEGKNAISKNVGLAARSD